MNIFLDVSKSYFIPFIILLVTFHNIQAQTNHYWNQQFGAKSSLRAGAVAGGVDDNSAVYYNPAAMAFIESNTLSVNANAYRFDIINLENGAGDGLNLSSNKLSLYPQLISGLRGFKNNPRLKWGYALLTRNYANIKLSQRQELISNVLVNRAGDEEFIGRYSYTATLNEQWGGLALAYKLSDHWSIGFTNFIAYRTQTHEILNDRKAVPTNTSTYEVVNYSTYESVTLTNIKALWKIAVAFRGGPWRAGMTITTPSLNLSGSGTVSREIISNNLDTYLPNNTYKNVYKSFLGTAQQNAGNTNFNSPASVALGLEYHFPKTVISITAEYFDQLFQYDIIKADRKPFLRPSTLDGPKVPTSDNFLSVSTVSKAIWNFAAGFQQRITPKMVANFGFRTDFDTFERNPKQRDNIIIGSTYWDLYHASGGLTFERGKHHLTIGVEYSFSDSKKTQQLTNFTDPKDITLLLSPLNENVKASVTSFNLIIGYTHFIDRNKE